MTDTLQTPPSPPPRPQPTPAGDDSRNVARLVATIAVVIAIAMVTDAFATVAIVGALLLMIMLHEFGHFVTAKSADMKVTEFFLGFGPRLWSIRRGETEYGVKAIPAGGYVRILGMSNVETVDPADEGRTYRQKPYWRRMTVALAGSAMHFVLAFALLWSLNGIVGLVNYDDPQPVVGSITRLESGPSPAELAGFRVGDRIVEVDGRQVREWDALRDYIRERPEQSLRFIVERDGRRVSLTARPMDLAALDGSLPGAAERSGQGFVGIGPTFAVERSGAVAALGDAGSDLKFYAVTSVKALGSFFTPGSLRDYGRQLTGEPGRVESTGEDGENRFLSPVGFVRVASQAADTGIRQVLILLVLINVFVGIFNLVPLPPLDGGHVAIATYEKVRSMISGRRHYADVTKLTPVAVAVVMLFVALGATSLWLDIVRPLSNPFQ